MVLFDLDQTLIDSREAEPLRRARKWSVVYRMVSRLSPYPGISELIARLRSSDIPVGIVSSSPGTYCQRVISHNGWDIAPLVAYHDTQRRKPHPDPILLAIREASVTPEDTVHVGDMAQDTEAARAAGVTAVGAAWGTLDLDGLKGSSPDFLFFKVAELESYLAGRFGLE